MPTRRPAPRPAHTQPSARVVTIPIHFVGSDRSRSEAAVRIQKVFRGFLVRRAVKKIRAVRAEVGAMERRVEDGGMADGLRRDERERVRVNELLMGLLFRLDSVPGVNSAVRDCRKKVIGRVLALHERVDAMETRNSSDSDHDHGSDSISEDATMEADQIVHEDPNQTTKEFVDVEENLASGDEECAVNAIQEAREEGITNGAVGERGNKYADERDLKEVMERMVEENKKLQRMISELCEREVSQSRLMNSLSQRVEALEKKFTKRRKTKKTNPCNARKGRYDL